MNLSSVVLLKSLGRDGVLREVERLGEGGDADMLLLNNLSAEDRVMFEVAVIDALTVWPRRERGRLRSALLRQGLDEQWSRRLYRCGVSTRVRIAALLELLKGR